jgi:hypothetical protein
MIIFEEDDAMGGVSINDVESEIECLRAQTESEMDFNQRVHKTGTHVPVDFGLHIYGLCRAQGVILT